MTYIRRDVGLLFGLRKHDHALTGEHPSGFAHLRSRVRSPLAAANYLAQTLFFVLVCTTSCYGCRTIRLAVMINPRARKTVPWLASVRSRRPWYGNQLLCPALHLRCGPAFISCACWSSFSRHRRSDGQPGDRCVNRVSLFEAARAFGEQTVQVSRVRSDTASHSEPR